MNKERAEFIIVPSRFWCLPAEFKFLRKKVASGWLQRDLWGHGRPHGPPFVSAWPGLLLVRCPPTCAPGLLECLHLMGDIGPVAGGRLLPHFLEQIGEVMQAADRCALPVLRDRGIFACRAQQNGVLNLKEWNTSAKERYRQFLIRCRKATLDTTALKKQPLYFRHIVV